MISEVLLENNTIKVLNLTGSEFKSKDAEYLSEAIRVNHTLVSLNLSHNQFAEEAGEFLGKFLGISW